MNSQQLEVRERRPVSNTLEQPCADMAPAQQKSHQDCLSNGSNGQTKQELVDQQHQIHKQVQVVQSLLSPPSSSVAVKCGPCLLTLKKIIQAFKGKCLRKLLCISYFEHKTGCRARSTSLLVHRNLFWQLVKREKLEWFRHVTRQ